jgi:hypothetical protein
MTIKEALKKIVINDNNIHQEITANICDKIILVEKTPSSNVDVNYYTYYEFAPRTLKPFFIKKDFYIVYSKDELVFTYVNNLTPNIFEWNKEIRDVIKSTYKIHTIKNRQSELFYHDNMILDKLNKFSTDVIYKSRLLSREIVVNFNRIKSEFIKYGLISKEDMMYLNETYKKYTKRFNTIDF